MIRGDGGAGGGAAVLLLALLLLLLSCNVQRADAAAMMQFMKLPLPVLVSNKRLNLPNQSVAHTLAVHGRFWPSSTDDKAQESAMTARATTIDALLAKLEAQFDAEKPEPFLAQTLGPRPGDIATCTDHVMQHKSQRTFYQYYAVKSMMRGSFARFPYVSDWQELKCDVCQRVTKQLVQDLVGNDVHSHTVPNALRQPRIKPKEICDGLVGTLKSDMMRTTPRTMSLHIVDADPAHLDAMVQQWGSVCERMVNDYKTNTAALARLTLFHKHFVLGNYAREHGELQSDAMLCTMLECCPTRGVMVPHAGDLELFDKLDVEPQDLVMLSRRPAVDELGCALSRQTLLVNLETVVDTSVPEEVEVLGVPLRMDRARALHTARLGQDTVKDEWINQTRLLSMRLDPGFHAMRTDEPASAAGVRARHMAKQLARAMEAIFSGTDMGESLGRYTAALLADTGDEAEALPERRRQEREEAPPDADGRRELPTIDLVQAEREAADPEQVMAVTHQQQALYGTPTAGPADPHLDRLEGPERRYPMATWSPQHAPPLRKAKPADDGPNRTWRGVATHERAPPWRELLLRRSQWEVLPADPLPAFEADPDDRQNPNNDRRGRGHVSVAVPPPPDEESSDTRFLSEDEDEDEADGPSREEEEDREKAMQELWAKSLPTDRWDAAAWLLLSTAARHHLTRLRDVLGDVLDAFRAANPGLPDFAVPSIIDPQPPPLCGADIDQMPPAVPDMLDIRLVKAWGITDASAVYQTLVPIVSGHAVTINELMIPPRPQLHAHCPRVHTQHLQLELRMNLARLRSSSPWDPDLPADVQAVEWWVGRNRLSGGYLPCLAAFIISAVTKLNVCKADEFEGCLTKPPHLDRTPCPAFLLFGKPECITVQFPRPRWSSPDAQTRQRVDTYRTNSVGGFDAAREGFGVPAATEFCARQGMALADGYDVGQAMMLTDGTFQTYDGHGVPCPAGPQCATFKDIICQHCTDAGMGERIAAGTRVVARPCPLGSDPFECQGRMYSVATVKEAQKDGSGKGVYLVNFDSTAESMWVDIDKIRELPQDHRCAGGE